MQQPRGSPFLSFRALFRWSLLKLLPLLRPWRSLDSELGRYFSDPRVFCEHFAQLEADRTEWTSELYISDVIGSMILSGIPFRSRAVERYDPYRCRWPEVQHLGG